MARCKARLIGDCGKKIMGNVCARVSERNNEEIPTYDYENYDFVWIESINLLKRETVEKAKPECVRLAFQFSDRATGVVTLFALQVKLRPVPFNTKHKLDWRCQLFRTGRTCVAATISIHKLIRREALSRILDGALVPVWQLFKLIHV